MFDEETRAALLAGESETVEFKSDAKKPLSDEDIVEATVCLANGSGGTLYVGVDDDGRVSGARPRHGDVTDPIRVQAVIGNKTVPQLVTRVEVLSEGASTVIRVRVPHSSVVTGTRRGLYVRRGLGADGKPACLPFLAHEMLADRIARGEVDFASIPEPAARMSDLSPTEFTRFRRLARAAGGRSSYLASLSDEDLLSALEIAELHRSGPVLRRGAVLLFGRPESIRRFVPTHETAFQELRRGVLKENVIATEGLLASAEDLYARLRSRNIEEEVVVGLVRSTIDRIPDVMARELVANALVHRDYTTIGTITVQIADDEVSVTSPGGFPRGVNLDNFLDLSNPRSRVLAQAFNHAGLVDRAGRGINRVFEATLRGGRPEPDYRRSTADRVYVSVQLGGADLQLVRFVIDHDERSGQPFDMVDLQLVRALRDDPRQSLSDLALVLQQPSARTRTRLTAMVESGLVEMRGDGRARRYALSGSTYRRLASDAGYVRIRAFDEPQQNEMILNFVRAHGSVSRSEAAELCGTSPEAARRLLLRLRDDGRLVIRGERRIARYYLP